MQKYEYIGKLSEGLIRVKAGVYPQYICGYINTLGEEVIPLIYSGVWNFHEGLAAVRIGNWSTGKCGFINTNGDVVVSFRYDKVKPFRNGIAKVKQDGEWFFIDLKENKIISLRSYSGSTYFHDGYAVVAIYIKDELNYVQHKYGIIDQNGKEVVPCIFPASSAFNAINRKHTVEFYLKNNYLDINR